MLSHLKTQFRFVQTVDSIQLQTTQPLHWIHKWLYYYSLTDRNFRHMSDVSWLLNLYNIADDCLHDWHYSQRKHIWNNTIYQIKISYVLKRDLFLF